MEELRLFLMTSDFHISDSENMTNNAMNGKRISFTSIESPYKLPNYSQTDISFHQSCIYVHLN